MVTPIAVVFELRLFFVPQTIALMVNRYKPMIRLLRGYWGQVINHKAS
jgi:hypothetical protein